MSDSATGALSTVAKVLIAVVIGVLAVIVVGSLAFGLLLQAAFGPRDGDAIARGEVEAGAAAIQAQLGYWHEGTDAETLAARHFTSADGDVTVRPFAWEGETNHSGGATVDVRIRSAVSAESATGMLQPSRTAGSAEGCFRFSVRSTQDVSYRRIDCPADETALPSPTATAEPELADDAEARLMAVLADTDAVALADDVRSAFSEPDVTTDVAITDSGELVAAVGVRQARDCIVLVRRADGAIERISFDRIQLEPGELGCSAALYTNPPL